MNTNMTRSLLRSAQGAPVPPSDGGDEYHGVLHQRTSKHVSASQSHSFTRSTIRSILSQPRAGSRDDGVTNSAHFFVSTEDALHMLQPSVPYLDHQTPAPCAAVRNRLGNDR